MSGNFDTSKLKEYYIKSFDDPTEEEEEKKEE